MTFPAQIGLDLVQNRLSVAMWAHVGHGRSWSMEALAVATGIPVTTLKAYRSGDATPTLPNLTLLFGTLGPEFVDQILALAGMGGVRRLDDAQVSPLLLGARAAALSALICRHMEDGVIDHREVLEQVAPVRLLHSACGGFLAHHDGARS